MNPKMGRLVKSQDEKKNGVPRFQPGNDPTWSSWRASSGFSEEIPVAVIVLVVFARDDERIYRVGVARGGYQTAADFAYLLFTVFFTVVAVGGGIFRLWRDLCSL